MKTIYLIRHAKSSWKEAKMSDHERPLNHRGEKDAPFMADILKKHKIKPDLIITSNAVRAVKTAEIFAGTLNYPIEEILFESDLYLADINDFLRHINSIEDKIDSCFIFSHNPGISEIACHLTGNERIDMPTCSIFGIEFNIESWREVKKNSGKGILFEYPKKYLKD